MLTIHCAGNRESLEWQPGRPLPEGATWFDLCRASAQETRAVEDMLGVSLPTREQISGLGLASRNHSDGDHLFLHVSRFADAEDEHKKGTPLALVLTPDVLVTVRFAKSCAFEAAAEQWHEGQPQEGSSGAFTELLETMTNRTAESMQEIATDVAELSDHVFGDRRGHSRMLRRWLMHVGHLEARLMRARASLLGIARVVEFMHDRQPKWIPQAQHGRLKTLGSDLATLDEFDAQLTQKLQFLLDAIFGFISINQNGVMKLLTVASVVTIPPLILAAIWGMNFKHMPELSWTWGYALALGLLLVSMLIPLALFKWRGWLSND